MKLLILIAILTAAAPILSQDESLTIGAIEFYGHAGVNVDVIRAALPLREGDPFSRASKPKIVSQITQAIKQATGHEPSDIAPICCNDRGRLMIYIGLRGESVSETLYIPPPRGSARLPAAALQVHR